MQFCESGYWSCLMMTFNRCLISSFSCGGIFLPFNWRLRYIRYLAMLALVILLTVAGFGHQPHLTTQNYLNSTQWLVLPSTISMLNALTRPPAAQPCTCCTANVQSSVPKLFTSK